MAGREQPLTPALSPLARGEGAGASPAPAALPTIAVDLRALVPEATGIGVYTRSLLGVLARDTVVASGMGILSGSDGRLRLVSATSPRRARRRRLDCRPYARPRGGHRDSRRPHW